MLIIPETQEGVKREFEKNKKFWTRVASHGRFRKTGGVVGLMLGKSGSAPRGAHMACTTTKAT